MRQTFDFHTLLAEFPVPSDNKMMRFGIAHSSARGRHWRFARCRLLIVVSAACWKFPPLKMHSRSLHSYRGAVDDDRSIEQPDYQHHLQLCSHGQAIPGSNCRPARD